MRKAKSIHVTCILTIDCRLPVKIVMLNRQMLDFRFDWIERMHDIAFDRRIIGAFTA